MSTNAMPDHVIAKALLRVGAEYRRARLRFARMRGPHEGFAVLLEEVDELWDEVKGNRPSLANEEAVHVAAMALAFIMEIPGNGVLCDAGDKA